MVKVIGFVVLVVGLIGLMFIARWKPDLRRIVAWLRSVSASKRFYTALVITGSILIVGSYVAGGISLFFAWLTKLPTAFWGSDFWTARNTWADLWGRAEWFGTFVKWFASAMVATFLWTTLVWPRISRFFYVKPEAETKKKEVTKPVGEESPRQVSLSKILVPIEQFWTVLVYWNLFGKGRGRIAFQYKDDYKLFGVWDIGYALKIPGVMDAEAHRVTKVTQEFHTDGIPNRGFKPFTDETEDFLSDELRALSSSISLPAVKSRPTTGMIAAKSNYTFQVTYNIDNLEKFKGLEPKFREDPVKYFESVVTGRMQQFGPIIFSDDTAVLEGIFIILGSEFEAAGFTTPEEYADYENHYATAQGKKHWDRVRKLTFKCSGKSRWRFNLDEHEIAELQNDPHTADCPYLRFLDKGVKVNDFKRQATTFPPNIQALYDARAEVEQKRMLNRTVLQQRLDDKRVSILERLMDAKATVDNLVMRMVQLKEALEKAMATGAPLPWELVFEFTIADELVRTMRLAPEGKYVMLGGLKDFAKTLANYTTQTGLSGPEGVVKSLIIPGK